MFGHVIMFCYKFVGWQIKTIPSKNNEKTNLQRKNILNMHTYEENVIKLHVCVCVCVKIKLIENIEPGAAVSA